jgi:putative CocE/NonD family hydrolase
MHKLFYLLLFIPFVSNAQQADSAWMVNHYVKKEQYIRMRDGIRLFTSIYMPVDSTQNIHPVIMMRTPYSCVVYGKGWAPLWNIYLAKYLRKGYIFVLQDVRGRWMSEGDFVNIRPFNPNKKTNQDIDEASDSYDTIDWLVKNVAGNNGKVGVFGTSYPGFYAAQAALSGHPALKAVSPQAPVTEWFIGDDIHHNGAFMVMDMFDFYVGWGFGMPHPKPTTVNAPALQPTTNDNYEYYLRRGRYPNLPL